MHAQEEAGGALLYGLADAAEGEGKSDRRKQKVSDILAGLARELLRQLSKTVGVSANMKAKVHEAATAAPLGTPAILALALAHSQQGVDADLTDERGDASETQGRLTFLGAYNVGRLLSRIQNFLGLLSKDDDAEKKRLTQALGIRWMQVDAADLRIRAGSPYVVFDLGCGDCSEAIIWNRLLGINVMAIDFKEQLVNSGEKALQVFDSLVPMEENKKASIQIKHLDMYDESLWDAQHVQGCRVKVYLYNQCMDNDGLNELCSMLLKRRNNIDLVCMTKTPQQITQVESGNEFLEKFVLVGTFPMPTWAGHADVDAFAPQEQVDGFKQCLYMQKREVRESLSLSLSLSLSCGSCGSLSQLSLSSLFSELSLSLLLTHSQAAGELVTEQSHEGGEALDEQGVAGSGGVVSLEICHLFLLEAVELVSLSPSFEDDDLETVCTDDSEDLFFAAEDGESQEVPNGVVDGETPDGGEAFPFLKEVGEKVSGVSDIRRVPVTLKYEFLNFMHVDALDDTNQHLAKFLSTPSEDSITEVLVENAVTEVGMVVVVDDEASEGAASNARVGFVLQTTRFVALWRALVSEAESVRDVDARRLLFAERLKALEARVNFTCVLFRSSAKTSSDLVKQCVIEMLQQKQGLAFTATCDALDRWSGTNELNGVMSLAFGAASSAQTGAAVAAPGSAARALFQLEAIRGRSSRAILDVPEWKHEDAPTTWALVFVFVDALRLALPNLAELKELADPRDASIAVRAFGEEIGVADVFFKLKNMISTHKNSYDDNQLLSLFYDAALLLLLRTTEGLYNDLRRSYSEAVKALQVRDVTPCSIERFFSVSERRGKRESLSRCLHFFLSWRARERERDRDRERERQRERDGERESL